MRRTLKGVDSVTCCNNGDDCLTTDGCCPAGLDTCNNNSVCCPQGTNCLTFAGAPACIDCSADAGREKCGSSCCSTLTENCVVDDRSGSSSCCSFAQTCVNDATGAPSCCMDGTECVLNTTSGARPEHQCCTPQTACDTFCCNAGAECIRNPPSANTCCPESQACGGRECCDPDTTKQQCLIDGVELVPVCCDLTGGEHACGTQCCHSDQKCTTPNGEDFNCCSAEQTCGDVCCLPPQQCADPKTSTCALMGGTNP